MPIYEYRCTLCGHELEALQKLSDPPLTSCPSCNTDALTKLVSAAGFQLKGSGWYATDFKDGGKKPADKPGASTAKADAADAKSASSESKSDAKSETKATPATGCGSGCACH